MMGTDLLVVYVRLNYYINSSDKLIDWCTQSQFSLMLLLLSMPVCMCPLTCDLAQLPVNAFSNLWVVYV